MNILSEKGNIRTLIFALLAIPAIGYLLLFSYQRHTQFEGKAQACKDKCEADGYLSHNFNWSAFSGESCECSVPAE